MKKTDQQGFSGPAVLLGILALVIIGASGFIVLTKDSAKDTQASLSSESESTLASSIDSDISGIKPISEIQTLASTDGLTITSIELEVEDGVLVYSVKFSDGSKKYFNASNGEVYVHSGSHNESDDSSDDSLPAQINVVLSANDARTKALSIYPAKSIEKIKLQSSGGVVVYSVRFKDGSRIDVDANSGNVVRQEDDSEEKQGDSSSDSSSDNNSPDDNSVNSQDDDSDDSQDNSTSPSTAPSSADIGVDAARSVALGTHSGTIKEVETETEDGYKVYSFRYTDSWRVDVRASDGVVVRSDN